MKNVLETLKYIAKHGGYWFDDTHAGVWLLSLSNARSIPDGSVGFTQADLREFLKHYEELTRER